MKRNDPWVPYEQPDVTEAGDPFVYRVASRSRPGMVHTVDMTQRGGYGACTCEFFPFANANFRRLQKRIPYAPRRIGVTECAHIFEVWLHLDETVLRPMLHAMRHGIPSPDIPMPDLTGFD